VIQARTNLFSRLSSIQAFMHVVTLHFPESSHLQWRTRSQESCRDGFANNLQHLQESRTPCLEASKHKFAIPQLDAATQPAKVGPILNLAKAPSRSGLSLPLLSQDPERIF
jgi:hypothetical protein